MTDPLVPLVAAELALRVDERVTAMAAAIAAQYPGAARAVLFYGSCLREANLDGLMLDFYLIVSDYRAAYGPGWLAWANRAIPPNVFPFEHGGLAAKYAVLSEADFARLCGPEADNVSVWARFAQPSRLVWAADEGARAAAVAAVASAAPTLFALTLPMLEPDASIAEIWERGFALTYGAELRAERSGRATSIVASDPERYAAFGEAALTRLLPGTGRGTAAKRWWRGASTSDSLVGSPLHQPSAGLPPRAGEEIRAAARWARLQRRGKWLTLVRLAKATTTFAGGIDYLAWKINRHAGTAIEIRPWQRRWPIVGALTLLPRLLRRGAVR